MKRLSLLLQVIALSGLTTGVNADVTQIFGWVEKARLHPGDLVISAKLDTGADHSSLNVKELTIFEREGEEWVRFQVTSDEGKTAAVERKLVRRAKIKRHVGPRQERAVVKLGICVGTIYQEAEVNLVDRSRFKYQLLLGRSFMENRVKKCLRIQRDLAHQSTLAYKIHLVFSAPLTSF